MISIFFKGHQDFTPWERNICDRSGQGTGDDRENILSVPSVITHDENPFFVSSLYS